MVMQAEHIPVHLGAMPDAVAAVAGEDHGDGTPWVLNDPFAGGTHLPDITVITPVLDDGELLGFAASRAHHADVGGPTPGSMPADSTTLEDEGVVISPRRLDDDAIEELAAQMRQPAQRRADLRAQLAANRAGAKRLVELRERLGADGLREAMAETVDYAERRTRACLAELEDGDARGARRARGRRRRPRAAPEGDGRRRRADARLHRLRRPARRQPQLPAGGHALGLLVRRARAHRPRHPARRGRDAARHGDRARGLPAQRALARPRSWRATSRRRSRVADLVLAAFGRALGQGTMNNLTLGNDEFTYYETLGGGQGACPDADGPSGVHVAMSNTLNTPVEALELEFPLRVVELRAAARLGRRRARTAAATASCARSRRSPDMDYSLLTERRRHAPPGADGGEPGARGTQPARRRGAAAEGARRRCAPGSG